MLYPPGVRPGQARLRTAQTSLLRAEVSYGGGLFGLRVLTPQGQWLVISTPSPAKNGIVDWGSCQFVVTGKEGTAPYYCHQNGSSPVVNNDLATLRNPVLLACQNTGLNPWTVSSAGHDVVEYDLRLPYVMLDATLTQDADRITCDATYTRTANYPGLQINRLNEPWLTLNTAEVASLTIDGATIQVGHLPTTPPDLRSVSAREARIALRCGRTLIVSWREAQWVRYWVHNPQVLCFTAIWADVPLSGGGARVAAQYTLEVE